MSSPAEEHMGFLVRWSQRACKNQWFERWTFEDVLSEAFLRADFLLREKYNPEKGRPTVFLGSCLRTDLSYAYQRSLGKCIHWVPKDNGKRRRTWVNKAPTAPCLESIAPSLEADRPVDLSDINLTPRERQIVQYATEGRSRKDISSRLGICVSRVGQIISENIRPKIVEWLKEESRSDTKTPGFGKH